MNTTPFELAAVLLTVTSGVGWANRKFTHLPSSVGMLAVGVLAALGLLAARLAWPEGKVAADLLSVVTHFDFAKAVMGSMLAYLLFAGALHTDASELLRRPVSITLLATLGVVVSTALVAGGVWLIGRAIGLELPFAWAVVFGALISPTDPVAVLTTLQRGDVPAALKAIMQGESLFNDGVGVVIFGAALTVAQGDATSVATLLGHVGIEALGGMALGGALGAGVMLLMRAIDDYSVEAGLSLALATGAYALAGRLHLSAPIAVVTAGLLIGTPGVRYAMSDLTQRYVRGFWTLVDDNLNAVLFLLLGLQVVVALSPTWRVWVLGVAAIPVVAAARALSVAPTVVRLVRVGELKPRHGPVLVWGGLRGAISVALALSIGQSPFREVILTGTYAVVVFSVLVQGMTFPVLVRWATAAPEKPDGVGPETS